ncbi:MAG: ribosome small subunit-dependent GTPase A [Lachnospiraceae bacterium]|nr:ribosome small subunit-dependent GTPase A [Lachnospiraceae bacterium]MDY3223712.1 ribosome small subunit-dependent GTPase A [Lachnospiraceae bacterium]
MQGRIVKGIAGFYYVFIPGVGILECKAKGIFRKNKLKPLVGDRVLVTLLNREEKTGNIEEILERENELIRPAVANIDQALVVFALKSPEPNFNLLDRFLLMMKQKGLPCILAFNKADLVGEDRLAEIRSLYEKSGHPIFFISAKNEMGLLELKDALLGKITTLAGPSGVGKSSLINSLQTGVSMETGTVSEKIQRGKHTTRHSELIPIDEDSFILDTPGFTSLSVFNLEKEELESLYSEFEPYRKHCRFTPCSHTHEPDCAVKEALEQGEISRVRYENYQQIYEELKEKKKY